jgi:hypothetical protein
MREGWREGEREGEREGGRKEGRKEGRTLNQGSLSASDLWMFFVYSVPPSKVSTSYQP